ncbi:SsrA-binding protein SmpB [Candidatus Parcubacteria bacterium]|nr:SsrA-binding protein SmpB [Candidatus Parcubacteria bacterium]
MSTLTENRRARFDYDVLETIEAGIVLTGQEVKSTKLGRMSLTGAFGTVHDNAVWLTGASIPPYQPKNAPANYDPERSRKLLLNRSEINRLVGKMKERGLTLVPLKVYTAHGRIKVELGLGRGKKTHDKRETMKRREARREIDRTLKNG